MVQTQKVNINVNEKTTPPVKLFSLKTTNDISNKSSSVNGMQKEPKLAISKTVEKP
jgi:hypothetical protein